MILVSQSWLGLVVHDRNIQQVEVFFTNIGDGRQQLNFSLLCSSGRHRSHVRKITWDFGVSIAEHSIKVNFSISLQRKYSFRYVISQRMPEIWLLY